MRTIADAVGVRTSSLYHHFPSKEDLLYAISLDVTRDFIAAHALALTGPAPAAQRLADLVRGHITYFAVHRLQQGVSRRELRELNDAHVEEVLGYERDYQRRVEGFLREAIAAGEFALPDARVGALALLDMVNGIGAWYREDGPLSVGELADLYVTLALALADSRG